MGMRDAAEAQRGGWVAAGDGVCELVLLAHEANLGAAMTARAWLAPEADVSVVALSAPDAFDGQDAAYRDEVLPPGVPVVTVTAELDAVERAIAEGRAALAASPARGRGRRRAA